MAEEPNSFTNPTKNPTPKAQQKPPKPFSSFLYKAISVFILIAVLPLFPSSSQSPEFANKTILSKGWELIHLLFVGIAISYGLFSSRNSDAEIEKEEQLKADDTPQSYVSSILQVSSVFDDEELVDSPKGLEFPQVTKNQTWSYSQYYPEQPVVMVTEESTDDRSTSTKPLFLPVRSLKSRSQFPESLDSGYGIDESLFMPYETDEYQKNAESLPNSAFDTPSRTPSFGSSTPRSASPSPKRLSPSNSIPREIRGKTRDDFVRKKSFNKSSPPPAPPPPPPHPSHLKHTSHLGSERRAAVRSFKNEIRDRSRRGVLHSDDSSSDSFKSDKYSYTARSVRTVRSNEAQRLPPVPKNQKEMNIEFTEESDSDDDVSEFSDVEELSDTASVETDKKHEAATDENEVDKKADEFIAKFREQIRLQRIASIKRSSTQQVARNPN